MKRLLIQLTWFLITVTVFTTVSFAEAPNIDVKFGLTAMRGNTKFKLGGPYPDTIGNNVYSFFLRESSFPLDIYAGCFETSIDISEKWTINADIKKNISHNPGTAECKGWGALLEDPPGSGIMLWIDSDSFDIYSRGDTDCDVFAIDFKLRYTLYACSFQFGSHNRKYFFFFGIGYLNQKIDYDVRNVDEWSPSGLHGTGVNSISGPVFAYDVTYQIPYVEFTAREEIGNFNVEASFGYSTRANATDNHKNLITRYVSERDCDGEAVMASLVFQYDITKRWFLSIGFDASRIRTRGDYTEFVEGNILRIKDRIESNQYNYTISAGYQF